MTEINPQTQNRIDRVFARARDENRAALILYLTAGFPDAETTRRLLPVLADSGCDLIELGVPFSDPIADGPTIQQASAEALENGMTLEGTLNILRDFRAEFETPVVLFGAFNPFHHHGIVESARMAAEAGADGFLAADLPLEEAGPFRDACRQSGLHLISLVAPTTPTGRIASYGRVSSGFVYCISVKGITGARQTMSEEVAPYLDRVRSATDLPIAVGFGISEPDQAAALATHADGIVVGSALINLIARCVGEGRDLENEVSQYVRSLVSALRRD